MVCGLMNPIQQNGYLMFILLLPVITRAQYDTTYIKKYPEYLSVFASSNDRLFTLTIKDAENKDNKAAYTSSAGISVGLGFNYKWLSLEFQRSIQQDVHSDYP